MKRVKYLVKNLFLMVTLFFSTNIFSQSQGPVAPEAASFEPIDATDMVNLSSGDFTYVLPILNVPSPEGGYPIALAYHAGIAMDQESTWTGLGWNLNAGAINRSVNGYPDDYNSALINEYFYDEGDREFMYSLSFGYTSYTGGSFGLGLSWGSNRSLGGYVSWGAGYKLAGGYGIGVSTRVGTNGISRSIGLQTPSGLTLGISASTNGNVDGSIGFKNNNGGFSISTNGILSIDLVQSSGKDNQVAVGLTLSSSGVSVDAKVTNRSAINDKNGNPTGNYNVDGGSGVGLSLQFENTLQMGDYTTRTSGWQIPLFLPTPSGIFSLSFGKQEFRYYLGKNENDYVSGPIYYSENILNNTIYKVNCSGEDYYGHPVSCGTFTTNNYQEAVDFKNGVERSSSVPDCQCQITTVGNEDAFMDIYEVPLDGTSLSNSSKVEFNNPTFPSYDKYNVQAQGLSGGMSSRLYDNGALFGLTGKENKEEFKLKYAIDGSTTSTPFYAKFTKRPNFYFDNEISTYLSTTDVSSASFKSSNQSNILSYYLGGVEVNAKPRRKNATYIEYFSNDEILNDYSTVKSKGYLLPSGTGFDRANKPKDGVGAFKITSVDGKTYHYSLPVYNHETITRTFGIIDERPSENQSYFEKRQLEAFATHWLLTAVTGPDYYDANNNGRSDEGDYGYWVEFDYGKWSDAFIWKNPFGQDYIDNDENPYIKTSVRGRKEIYYLDKIKTRTHTALFLKSERHDGHSQYWDYKSVEHITGRDQNSSAFQSRFIVPSHAPLKLDKIILVENENDNTTKTSGSSSHGYVDIIYNNSDKPTERAYYRLKDNVLDLGDNWSGLLAKASKVIDLTYENPSSSLVKGSPNTKNNNYGRLTLKSVNFKGKYGTDIMPPYVFSYKNSAYSFDIEDKDGFGYKTNDNDLWSLNKIKTPQGGEVIINYESHKFMSVISSDITFRPSSSDYKIIPDYDGSNLNDGGQPRAYYIESTEDLGIQIGDRLKIDYLYTAYIHEGYWCNGYCGHEEVSCEFDGYGTIIQDLGNNKFFLLPDQGGHICDRFDGSNNSTSWNIDYYDLDFSATYEVTNPIESGGIRVSGITTTDGIDSFTTEYSYGENGNGVGYISYLPFAPELQEELPYSAELPAPRVMYEFVSMETKDINNQSDIKTQYKFKILKEKDPNDIKFGDLYEIDITRNDNYSNSVANTNVCSYIVKDNLATLGALLEVSTYNSAGHLLSKIENEYYAPEETPYKIGKTQESYQSYKTVDYEDVNKKDKWLVNSSTRIKYPNLLKKSTEHKMNNQYSTEFGDLDPITGKSRELFSYSSEGVKFKTKSVFAYSKYSGMGSKVDNIDNFNMLSQETGSFSYLIDPITNDERIIGASISTWNNNWTYRDHIGVESSPTNIKEKIWRKHIDYTWKGNIGSDGAFIGYNQSNDDGFNWGVGNAQSNQKWKNISQTTRYDHYSSSIEVKDINGNYASLKKGDNNSKVLATSNAAYTEMYYSGAEYRVDQDKSYFDGEIKSFGYALSKTAHTGDYIVSIGKNQNAFEVKVPARAERNTPKRRRFKVSVWVRTAQKDKAVIKVGGSKILFRKNETITAGIWSLLNGYITIPPRQTTVAITSTSGTIELDDFRLHPITASMTSYVYNKFDEVTFITGANGLSTKYVYDEAGKLEETWVEVLDNPKAEIVGGFKRVHKNTYNYKNFNVTSFLPMSLNSSSTFTNYIINGGSGEFRYNWKIQVFKNGVQRQVRELTTRVGNIRLRPIENHRCSDVDINLKVIDLETNRSLDVFKFKRGDCSDGGDDPIPPGCFIAGTKITMSDGTLKNIEDVKVGDNIKTFNIDTKKIEEGEVLEFINPIKNNFIEIEFENGIKNTNTLDHPYYVKDKGWSSYDPKLTNINYKAKTQTLEVGDIVIMYKNSKVKFTKIKEITEIKQKQKVFNLKKVSKNHNYFANGILAHNKSKI